MPKNSPDSSSLEPVKHLSTRLQQKLVRRVKKQRKRFRSSGQPYPLVMDMPGTEEKLPAPATASSYITGQRQRVAFAIASLVLVMLLTFGLAWIAAATHAANGIWLLIIIVVALFISAAVLFNLLLSCKR